MTKFDFLVTLLILGCVGSLLFRRKLERRSVVKLPKLAGAVTKNSFLTRFIVHLRRVSGKTSRSDKHNLSGYLYRLGKQLNIRAVKDPASLKLLIHIVLCYIGVRFYRTLKYSILLSII